eukprot:1304496-Pyramimonas_sp.AAC.1
METTTTGSSSPSGTGASTSSSGSCSAISTGTSTTASASSSAKSSTKLFFGNTTCMGDKAWGYLCQTSRTHDYVTACETHVHQRDLGKWTSKARGAGLKLLANGARAKSRWKQAHPDQEARANEGGEWMLVRNHRPAQ